MEIELNYIFLENIRSVKYSKSTLLCITRVFQIMSIFFSYFNQKKLFLLVFCFYILVSGHASLYAKSIEITIWDFPRWLEPGEKTDRFTWIKRKIKEFEKDNPNVKVRLNKLTWKRGKEKLKISALGGHSPDIAPGPPSVSIRT